MLKNDDKAMIIFYEIERHCSLTVFSSLTFFCLDQMTDISFCLDKITNWSFRIFLIIYVRIKSNSVSYLRCVIFCNYTILSYNFLEDMSWFFMA